MSAPTPCAFPEWAPRADGRERAQHSQANALPYRSGSQSGSQAGHSRQRAGVLGAILAAIVVMAAAGVLAWMLVLPGIAQARFAATTGAQLRLRGLMGDPFAGRASVTGWTLHADATPTSVVLAKGAAAEVVAPGWRGALDGTTTATAPLRIESLSIRLAEVRLAPDAKGRWPLLATLAAVGLPYEVNGPIGTDAPHLHIARLQLTVETIVIRDARTARDVKVRIDWRGEFKNLTHSRPVVVALLAAARRE